MGYTNKHVGIVVSDMQSGEVYAVQAENYTFVSPDTLRNIFPADTEAAYLDDDSFTKNAFLSALGKVSAPIQPQSDTENSET